jgi:hypothetical protein
MKATIEVPDELYRQVKAKSALQGRPVREVAVELFRGWVGEAKPTPAPKKLMLTGGRGAPPWFGSLRQYAKNAKGRHDMASIRKSIARARAAEWTAKERFS